MPLFSKPHTDHSKHLCSMIASGVTVGEYAELVKNPKFVCRQCGRAAAEDANLCDPVSLEHFEPY